MKFLIIAIITSLSLAFIYDGYYRTKQDYEPSIENYRQAISHNDIETINILNDRIEQISSDCREDYMQMFKPLIDWLEVYQVEVYQKGNLKKTNLIINTRDAIVKTLVLNNNRCEG